MQNVLLAIATAEPVKDRLIRHWRERKFGFELYPPPIISRRTPGTACWWRSSIPPSPSPRHGRDRQAAGPAGAATDPGPATEEQPLRADGAPLLGGAGRGWVKLPPSVPASARP